MRKPISFANMMKAAAFVSFFTTAVLVLLYRHRPWDWLFAAAITAGTTFYHFAMRLVVGTIVPLCVKQPMKYRWFHPKDFEPKLYQLLKVKQWKDRMPTYDPASFSLHGNTMRQIVDNCCVSEAVHDGIILLSFVPLVFACWWGAFPVFLTTSLLAAAFDCCFVIMQRYNRPRLLRILAKKETKAHE